jgi:hypothetical protein
VTWTSPAATGSPSSVTEVNPRKHRRRNDMAGLANPVLTLTPDRATKTVRAVATCRINFNPFELSEMQQGLKFRFRAKLFGADAAAGGDDDLFTFTPPKTYPDATPNDVEDVTFEETLALEVLDEDAIGTDSVFAAFELTSNGNMSPLRRKSPKVSGAI